MCEHMPIIAPEVLKHLRPWLTEFGSAILRLASPFIGKAHSQQVICTCFFRLTQRLLQRYFWEKISRLESTPITEK
jgi:hypothetical protein